jgi:hypothetical protein
MKNKMKISFILAIITVIASIPVVTAETNQDPIQPPEGEYFPFGEIVKEVWDVNLQEWTNFVSAGINETVKFKITIKYKLTDHPNANHSMNIIIYDLLPECLNYSDDIIEPDTEVLDKLVKWDLGDKILYDNESVSLVFNATAVNCTSPNGEENFAAVYAKETCSQRQLYQNNTATIVVSCEEPCEPGIEVTKKVKNSVGEWDEYVDGLNIGDFVDFKIDIIYHDCDAGFELLNLEIRDELPCCLVYNDTIDISTTGPFIQDPTIETTINEKIIYWNWTFGQAIVLQDNDSLTIEFKAEFVNYCESEDDNWIYVVAWGCGDLIFMGEDNVTVNCTQPEPEFCKKAYDGNNWVDEINTTVGDTLRFKLAVTYYGMEEFNILKFKDELPCILEYADNAMAYVKDDSGVVIHSMPIEGDLQSDNKTLWFNFTYEHNFTLSDGIEISVEFDVLVIGQSECGCDCETEAVNKAWLYLLLCGEEEPVYELYDELGIHSEGNCPPYSLGFLTGPNTGLVDEVLSFTTSVVDPDEDQVSFMIDWGDGTAKVWDGPHNNEDVVSVSHTFTKEGAYKIKIKARDEHLLESEWTSTMIVTITEEEEPPETIIQLSVPIMYHVKNVDGYIRNAGEASVTNVEWTLTISGGLLGGPIESHGTIPSIASGAAQYITSNDIKFEFGKRTINIFVKVDNKEFSETFSCFILGRFVLIL